MIHTVLLCLCLWRLVDATAVEFVPVFEGDSVTLNSGLTEMKDDDVIQWRFENTFTLIAEINKRANRITVCDDVLDGRFRDRLKMDNQTGSLTITNTRTEHAGYYVLLINNVRKNFYLTFIDEISVTEGGSVTLNSDLTEINDPIQWRFGTNDTLIAEINKRVNRITVYDDVLDGRFRDRLKLDNQTGSLIITNITLKHDGYYVLEINNVKKKFSLTFIDEISVMEGDSVTLNSDLTEINDPIRWMFGTENTLIAKINKRADIFTVYDDVLDGRFRDRLKMDNQTGSLTITNITTEHAGRYKRLTGTSPLLKIFNVSFYARLPVPVISSNSSQCSSSSSSSYSLVCSAVNVSHVTLSWYKGNSLLSSISVSDLSIISLPLEVEYQDKNTYSCVLNNPISNQTQHLNITQLCHTCSDSVQCCGPTEAVIRLVLSALVGVAAVAAVVVLVYDIRSRRAERDQAQIHTSGSIEI